MVQTRAQGPDIQQEAREKARRMLFFKMGTFILFLIIGLDVD
jgi:hypothetical protein